VLVEVNTGSQGKLGPSKSKRQPKMRPTEIQWASLERNKESLSPRNASGARIGSRAFSPGVIYTLHDVDIGLSACDRGICVVGRSNGRGVETLVGSGAARRPVDVVARDWIRCRGRSAPSQIDLMRCRCRCAGSAQREICSWIGGRVAGDCELARSRTRSGRSKLQIQVERLTGIQRDRKARSRH
jgi:hypothetical protein